MKTTNIIAASEIGIFFTGLSRGLPLWILSLWIWSL